jgi:hypothetical protein
MDQGTRGEHLDRLAGAIESVTIPHPLADELALLLPARGREVRQKNTVRCGTDPGLDASLGEG